MLKDPAKTVDEIVKWIQIYFEYNGPEASAVVGISGGKDSTIVAALCVKALGKDRVFGILMPKAIQPDIQDSMDVVDLLGIKHVTINIHNPVEAMMDEFFDVLPMSRQAEINLPPRIRMATLYAVAQSLPNGGRVANTCNLSEDFIGYSTKFGDSAGDFAPISKLVMHEVLQIGHALDLPDYLVEKVPSDGLCGKTDEDNFGFSYDILDRYILTNCCEDEEIREKIIRLNRQNMHKDHKILCYNYPVREREQWVIKFPKNAEDVKQSE